MTKPVRCWSKTQDHKEGRSREARSSRSTPPKTVPRMDSSGLVALEMSPSEPYRSLFFQVTASHLPFMVSFCFRSLSQISERLGSIYGLLLLCLFLACAPRIPSWEDQHASICSQDGFTSTFQEKLFKEKLCCILFHQSRNTRRPNTTRCSMRLGFACLILQPFLLESEVNGSSGLISALTLLTTGQIFQVMLKSHRK